MIAFNTLHSLVQQYQAEGHVSFELGEQDLRRAHLILHPPATRAEVTHCETRLGAPLPEAYREFLLSWNGAVLYQSGRYALQLCGTAELTALNEHLTGTYTEQERPGLIAFGYLPGTGGDYLAFTRDGSVLDGHRALPPADWPRRRIAADFIAFLDRLITGRGYYYWMAEHF